jgi:hypothetical protein
LNISDEVGLSDDFESSERTTQEATDISDPTTQDTPEEAEAEPEGVPVSEEEEPVPMVEEEGVEYEDVPPLYQQARVLFTHAEVTPGAEVDLKWTAPDEAGLRAFLVERMGFGVDRVASGIKRLQEAQQKKSQQRMDRYYTLHTHLLICVS